MTVPNAEFLSLKETARILLRFIFINHNWNSGEGYKPQ